MTCPTRCIIFLEQNDFVCSVFCCNILLKNCQSHGTITEASTQEGSFYQRGNTFQGSNTDSVRHISIISLSFPFWTETETKTSENCLWWKFNDGCQLNGNNWWLARRIIYERLWIIEQAHSLSLSFIVLWSMLQSREELGQTESLLTLHKTLSF